MTTIDYDSINKYIIEYINSDEFNNNTKYIDNIEIDYSLIDKYIQDYINNNIIQFIPILSNNDKQIIDDIMTEAIYNYLDNNIHNILFSILNYYENYPIFQ
jgi:hypothetical protein